MRRAITEISIPEDGSGDKLKGLGTFYRTLGGAPIAIGVLLPREKDPWVVKNSISDSAAAIENLLLAAWDKGLRTCWMTGPLKGGGDDCIIHGDSKGSRPWPSSPGLRIPCAAQKDVSERPGIGFD
jgi:hypothetical protein